MPRYFCDYCDAYLTHDSAPGRQQHIRGWKHRENFKMYYQNHYQAWMMEQQMAHMQNMQQMQMMGGGINLPGNMTSGLPPGMMGSAPGMAGFPPGAALGLPPPVFRPPPGMAPPTFLPPPIMPQPVQQPVSAASVDNSISEMKLVES